MAQNQRPPQQPQRAIANGSPLQDHAPRSATIFEYDIPNDDGLHDEVTKDFGSIRSIGFRHLSPLEEKDAAFASKGEVVQLAYELARRSIVEVTNERGETIRVNEHNGSSDMLWAQIHPKIRQLVTVAYSDEAAPTARAAESFRKSRRVKA